jgi:circadian clock protein KaiC
MDVLEPYNTDFLETFIPNLPDKIFIRGRNYLISGQPGTGKSCFCYTFVKEGLDAGENAVYMTFDQKARNVLLDAKSFGIDLVRPYEEKKLVIIEGADYMGKINLNPDTLQQSQSGIIEMMDNASRDIKRIEAKRFVLDPIAPVLTPSFVTPARREGVLDISSAFGGRILDTSHESWVRLFLLDLMGHTPDFATTNLFTSEIPVDSPHSWSRYGFEEYMVDGIFVLSLEERGHRYRRVMKMPKARGSKVQPAFYEFEIGYRGIRVVRNLSEPSRRRKPKKRAKI